MSERQESELYEWVLREADNPRAATCGPWTSRDHIVQEGIKNKHGFEREDIESAISTALVRNDLLEWHGLLVPVTKGKLRSVIEAEREADHTRKILVGKVNRYLQTLKTEVPQ